MGRYDIAIEKKDKTLAIIIELKVADDNPEKVAKVALKQIKEQEYYKDFEAKGVKKINTYSFAFKDKDVTVR